MNLSTQYNTKNSFTKIKISNVGFCIHYKTVEELDPIPMFELSDEAVFSFDFDNQKQLEIFNQLVNAATEISPDNFSIEKDFLVTGLFKSITQTQEYTEFVWQKDNEAECSFSMKNTDFPFAAINIARWIANWQEATLNDEKKKFFTTSHHLEQMMLSNGNKIARSSSLNNYKQAIRKELAGIDKSSRIDLITSLH